MKTKQFYIKERHNPQLGVYYVPMGQLTQAEARRHENPIYGDNIMIGFLTESEYKARLSELKANGEHIN